MHASDIANGSMKYNTYIKWSALLIQEFNYQVLCEEKNSIATTEFLRYKGLVSFYKGQIFFLSKNNKINLLFHCLKEFILNFQEFLCINNVKKITINFKKI